MELCENKNIDIDWIHFGDNDDKYEIKLDEKIIGITTISISTFNFEDIPSFDSHVLWIFFGDYNEDDVKKFIELKEDEVMSRLTTEWSNKGYEHLVNYTGIIINGRNVWDEFGGYTFNGKVISDRVARK